MYILSTLVLFDVAMSKAEVLFSSCLLSVDMWEVLRVNFTVGVDTEIRKEMSKQ